MAPPSISQFRGQKQYASGALIQLLPSLSEIEVMLKFVPELPTAHCAAAIAKIDIGDDVTDKDPCLLLMDQKGKMALTGPISTIDELPTGYSLVASMGPSTDVERLTHRIVWADADRLRR
ncbi:hypothetical protein FCE95_07705 [Luteimonas gilva]|uniref:Uncharacterized protein n=1 Tax=Luteimonas gilva TaxID=2572684 RepID=A0A4U5K4Y8_9GAMM|nr:hypothetical protein [Luteimonas gilva]TKR34139.1 hypothetical protein FCE95_07705 [Luteimonas gilva]